MSQQVLTRFSQELVRVKSDFATEMVSVRGNRANPAMVDEIEVEAYGAKMKLKELSHISASDSRMIVVEPWDATLVDIIAKTLGAAGLGINPAVDGKIIRLPLPPLTEERRLEMVRMVKSKLEEVKVRARQLRHNAMESLEREKKEGSLSEDEMKRAENEVQKQLDSAIRELGENGKSKEQELMTV
jgi:ribosome recycling factor